MIATVWFCLVAIMIAGYVVLDGFDLGAGIVHLFVAHTDRERRQVLRSIGPVWDGNEVWLLAGGGTLYFAFPALYSAAFSGFYLALMMVLWLLILRGISIEFRSHIESPVWRPFWDLVFGGSSALLALLLGRRSRQRGSRRTARFRRILFPSALDQLPTRQERRYRGLVYPSDRRGVFRRSNGPWLLLGGIPHRRRFAIARPRARRQGMVGRPDLHGVDHVGKLSPAAAPGRAVLRASLGLCVSAACVIRAGRYEVIRLHAAIPVHSYAPASI